MPKLFYFLKDRIEKLEKEELQDLLMPLKEWADIVAHASRLYERIKRKTLCTQLKQIRNHNTLSWFLKHPDSSHGLVFLEYK